MASVPNRAMNADSPAIITLSGMARLAMAAISVPSRKQVRFTSLVARDRPRSGVASEVVEGDGLADHL